jgi:hypothetical protein
MNPRLEELRRKLQSLRCNKEIEQIDQKMVDLRRTHIPNILLLRLLELERQHLDALRSFAMLTDKRCWEERRWIAQHAAPSERPANDNQFEVVI